MKKVVLIYLVFVAIAVSTAFTMYNNDSTNGSARSQDDSMDGIWNGKMNGQPASIEISRMNYLLKIQGVNLGKGNISFGDSKVTLTSTHAWSGEKWVNYEETVTGNYVRRDKATFILSNFSGNYSSVNGTWTLQSKK